MIERRKMKPGDWVHCTQISPEFECQGQRPKAKVSGDRKRKKCGILFGSRPLGRGPHAAFFPRAVFEGVATPVGKSTHAV